ncbi:MAG: FtsX-like permease family protein [Acidobacteria bacterium]|jgi:putative ABC transport system permease protein|nr:FtsX-like permease family protein [Acidobacteriota bacterium]
MTGRGDRIALMATLAWRSLRRRALSSAVTVIAVGVASGLVLAVWSIQDQARRAFTATPGGFDAVLGARGSQLQLVLNTVFHLDTSPGNIPWTMYERMRNDPRVAAAIPYAVGDSYASYRIVGTSSELFSRASLGDGALVIEPGGRVFGPAAREAVVGSMVARRASLGLGTTFEPRHGFGADATQHHESFSVVGVLKATGRPADRVIWVPVDAMLALEGHVIRGAGVEYVPRPGAAIPIEHKELSAVMLRLCDPNAGFSLDDEINRRGRTATLAWPIGTSVAEVFQKLGWLGEILRVVALLTVLVAVASVLAGIHNTLEARSREFALLRSVGASRGIVSGVVAGEAFLLGSFGAVVGVAVYAAIFAVSAAAVHARAGVILDPFAYHPVLLLGPVITVLAALLAGVVPAVAAYRSDVSTALTRS